MKREIKFRAWVRHGKMQYDVVPWQWDFCIDRMLVKCINSTGTGLLGSGGDEAAWEAGGFRYVDEQDKNLMQYTGLKDKNSKEIYDGDIVQTNHVSKGVIEWSPMASQWWITFTDDVRYRKRYRELTPDFGDGQNYCQYLEVIGNIYENPELLNN